MIKRRVSNPQPEHSDYPVGYGRPPSEHRFKPGRSGNPNGRSKKIKTELGSSPEWGTSTFASGRVLYEEVTVTQNGKSKKMPMIEAVHRRRAADALKGGNRLLQREVIAAADAHEQRIVQADIALYFEYKRKKIDGQKVIEQARQAGRAEPFLLPHPDDIIIDDEMMTYRVDGPNCQTTLALERWQVQLRDHLALRYVYQMRFPSLIHPVNPDGHKTYGEGAKVMNEGLCPRLRWGEPGFRKATQAHGAKGFRFIERDMTECLLALRKTWREEPELEPLRKDKRYARMVNNLLQFRTRSQERRLWQFCQKQARSALSLVFGPQLVASVPVQAGLQSHAERETEYQRLLASVPSDIAARAKTLATQLSDILHHVEP